MAAPTATPRVAPVGVNLGDGYQSKLTPAADTDVSFWEKSVTPFGMDGGEAVDTTTMHNTTYRTMAPRGLITSTALEMTAAYDPRVLDQIVALINVETTYSIEFPDGSDWAMFGFLRSFTPGALVEGTQPEATIVIEPTNWDSSNSVEAGPNWESSTGSA
tara:strand:+ start:28544 stop:29023 length:480 start_codon:yes stop_codon:yes gene_type:complete